MSKQNEKLIKNMEIYDKKKKAEQQESKIHREKQERKQISNKKKTRMYHI